MIHFDIVDPAKGRAELILDATLLPEHFGLYFLGRLCHLVGRHPPRVNKSSAPINATVTAAEVPVEAPAGASE